MQAELVVTEHERASRLAGAFIAGLSSPKTRSNYRAGLHGWFEWLESFGLDPLETHRTHVELYVRHLEQRGYAASTVGQRISVVSSFYRFCVIEEQLAHNPVAAARRPPRVSESSSLALTRHELTDWLSAAERRGGYVYPAACLLAMNGLRVGELCATNVSDLGESTWHRTLQLRASTTKGSKPAVVPLAPRTMQALDRALDGRTSGALLLNRHRRRMTPYNVAYFVRVLCDDIGVRRRITPHSLRHSAITIALDAGVGLRDVQDFARHEDPRTTRRYDRARHQLNRHATYAISQYLAGGS